jgi:hypothetical protein
MKPWLIRTDVMAAVVLNRAAHTMGDRYVNMATLDPMVIRSRPVILPRWEAFEPYGGDERVAELVTALADIAE